MSTYTSSDKIISTYRKNNMNTAAVDVINDFEVGNKYEVYSTKTGSSLSKIYSNTAIYEKDSNGNFVLDDEGNKILANNPQNNVYGLCASADLENELWKFYINSDENYLIEISSDDSQLITRTSENNVNTKYRQLTVDSTNYYVINSDKDYSWTNPDITIVENNEDEADVSIITEYRKSLQTTQFFAEYQSDTIKTEVYYYIYNEDGSEKLDGIVAYCKKREDEQLTFYLNNESNWSIEISDSDEAFARELYILDNETIISYAKMLVIDNVNNYVIYSDKFETVESEIASTDDTADTTTE